MAAAERRLLTVREVAERIRSTPESVRRWIRQGRLRAARPGHTKLGFRIAEDDLERFLAERTRGGTPEAGPP